jgi:hypothetical protein
MGRDGVLGGAEPSILIGKDALREWLSSDVKLKKIIRGGGEKSSKNTICQNS